MGGHLVPASEGRYIAAALKQQWQQLADLQATLCATTGLVALQAAQIAHLQDQACSAEAQRMRDSPPAAQAAEHTAPPKTADGSRGDAAAPGKLLVGRLPAGAAGMRTPSPPGGRRPATTAHQGMLASMRSDLEAWRAK